MESVIAYETPCELKWKLQYADVCFCEPPELYIQITPVLPFFNNTLFEQGIVFDPIVLMRSMTIAATYQIITGEEGVGGSSVGIEDSVIVSYPRSDVVAWELSIKDFRAALEANFAEKNGVIRFIFNRKKYEEDIRSLIEEVQLEAKSPVEVTRLGDNLLPQKISLNQLGVKSLMIGFFDPDCGGMTLEKICTIDLSRL